MTALDELVDVLRTELRSAPQSLNDTETKTGMLAGVVEVGSARTAPTVDESVYHHAGYLAGHLLGWLLQRGRPLDSRLRLLAAGYAASLADPGGQAMLDKPDRPVTAHSYAAIRVEQQTHRALSESDERMLLGWLLEQTGKPYSQTIDATWRRLRVRRHERLGLGPLA